MEDLSYINFAHLPYIEKLLIDYSKNPQSVESSWRNFFDGLHLGFQNANKVVETSRFNDLRIFKLIEAYRTYGHVIAKTNPIQDALEDVPELSLKNLGFEQEELTNLFPTYGLLSEDEAPLHVIIDALKQIYCGEIGIEYIDCQSVELEKWLQQEIEPKRFRPQFTNEEKKNILESLSKSELFESFLHTKYVGQKRFSLEGAETLIPILNEAIEYGSELDAEEFVIGMSHRGRLNVLANILNKPYAQIFSEFEDIVINETLSSGGDVKYHKGFSADIFTKKAKKIHLRLVANPSHLESVDAVVEGIVRAKQTMRRDEKRKRVLPILIHGDASLAGQGEVYEVMQLYRLEGYQTGGTIHIVVNNHIGFTTLPNEARSTRYCTDIARTFSAPVFHVNTEDPEGCVYAIRLALQIRQQFGCDVFVDLNCYRKYGHNEGDEPNFTQPVIYKKISERSSSREIYLHKLLEEKILTKNDVNELERKFKQFLHQELEGIKTKNIPTESTLKGAWEGFSSASKDEIFANYDTSVKIETLRTIIQSFTHLPENFSVHPKIARLFQDKIKIMDLPFSENHVDWGLGEHLAIGSLLWEGIPVRISGQDSQRGTFSHRHAVIVDQNTSQKYFPLKHLKQDQGLFEIYNSPLSEFAVLAFEFGYSLSYPQALVIWEAQFGDFANGAQVVIDQYISSSESKWARFSGLVLYLPHGYEGQGPEHSSARIERFLQLTAENNMQIVNPSNPAQLFHVIRRQMMRPFRKPLIIFTPKGLLRYAPSFSSLLSLSQSCFEEVLDDLKATKSTKRIIFCTGRVYYDLISERLKRKRETDAIIRIEQLYPWPENKIKFLIDKYSKCEIYLWVQEEPVNMGAAEFIKHFMRPLLNKELKIVARKRSSSPAIGSHFIHEKEHADLMNNVFENNSEFHVSG